MKWRWQPSKKRSQNSDSMIQDLGERIEAKIEKMQEMFTKDLEELKNKQAEMNNTLEGIISRITYVKEQISDLEDRTLEITATEQNTEKKQWGKKKDGLRITYSQAHSVQQDSCSNLMKKSKSSQRNKI